VSDVLRRSCLIELIFIYSIILSPTRGVGFMREHALTLKVGRAVDMGCTNTHKYICMYVCMCVYRYMEQRPSFENKVIVVRDVCADWQDLPLHHCSALTLVL
jgi:hypothetical protein